MLIRRVGGPTPTKTGERAFNRDASLGQRRDTRQAHGERAALSMSVTRRLHRAAVTFDKTTNEGQPDAQSGSIAIALYKQLEHPWHQIRVDADSGVPNTKDCIASVALHGNVERTARGRVLDGVAE